MNNNGMQIRMQGQIMGVMSNSGEFDGRSYDYCKVIVATPLTGDRNLGMGVSEYAFGKSANFDRFKDCKFPFEADIVAQIVTTGKTQKVEMLDFRPLPIAVKKDQ